MAYRDLREFLERCEQAGELARISHPVDLDYELAAISRRSIARGGPANRALIFEQPLGHTGQPVLTNLLTNRSRYYLAMETDQEHFPAEYARRTREPLAPRTVSTGPVKDVVRLGSDVALAGFPIPRCYERDGGRFVTAGCWITRDPETGRHNVGVYRGQVHADDEIGVLAAPYRGLMACARKMWARGERLPLAVVIGADPTVYMAAAAEWPPDVDELEMAGAFRQEPLDLIPCESIPLSVPASAEIVVEAELDPEWRKPEGPFGEFTGFYGGGSEQPYARIKAITHRRDPIYYAPVEGQPPSSAAFAVGLPLEAEVQRLVTVPGLLQVNVCVGSSRLLAVAQIRKTFEGQGKAIGMAILATPPARGIKSVVVVDEDVDPFNWTEVEWALGVRMQPERDVEILKDMLGVWLDPSLPPSERESRACRTSKMVIDATQPIHVSYPEKCNFPAGVVERVQAQWGNLGLPY